MHCVLHVNSSLYYSFTITMNDNILDVQNNDQDGVLAKVDLVGKDDGLIECYM